MKSSFLPIAMLRTRTSTSLLRSIQLSLFAEMVLTAGIAMAPIVVSPLLLAAVRLFAAAAAAAAVNMR